MQRFENAVESLEQALRTPPRLSQSWSHIVRHRAGQVADALTAESAVAVDPWLSARANRLERERVRLLARLAVLRTTLTDAADPEPVRETLSRLLLDVRHHHQRVTDLAYDALSLDVGGSD